MADNTISSISIDDIFQTTSVGSLDKAVGNNLYGINHQQMPTAVISNREQQGYTFFVRPQLNLQADNIRNVRRLMPLMADYSDVSIHRVIRTLLDPRLQAGYTFNKQSIAPITCPLTDPDMAFIPILTNNLTSISGWPDTVSPVYTSKPGIVEEAVSMYDGPVQNFGTYTLDATFRNTVSDPIIYMFYVWQTYGDCVFEGTMMPYPDMLASNRIDYHTRIYRLVLDSRKNKVTKILSTGPAIPISIPVGTFGDYNKERPFSEQNKELTVRFQCTGFEVFDPILLSEFNQTVQMFNASMKDDNLESDMIQVPAHLRQLFNNRGYPRIDPDTYQLQWWVPQSLYSSRTLALLTTYSQAYPDVDIANSTESE